MMFEASGIFAQAQALRDDALVPSSVDKIAGANCFACGCLELYALFVNLKAGYFGLLPRHCTVVNGEIMKVSINILPEPMIFVPRARAELQAFAPIINLTRPVIDIAKVAFNAASRADMFRQPLRIYNVLQLGQVIFFSQN